MNIQMEKDLGQGVWEGPKNSHVLSRPIPLPVPPRVQKTGSLPHPVLLDFYGSFIMQARPIIDSSSTLLSPFCRMERS